LLVKIERKIGGGFRKTLAENINHKGELKNVLAYKNTNVVFKNAPGTKYSSNEKAKVREVLQKKQSDYAEQHHAAEENVTKHLLKFE
jgi:hypothetical protein